MVEPQFSKLDVAGSSPVLRSPGVLSRAAKGADCKSAVIDFGGSSPSCPTNGTLYQLVR